MTNTNITAFRQHVFQYVDQAVVYGDVVNVSTKNGNAVLLSESDYNSLLETLHLCSIPGMVESIKAADAEPLEACTPYDPEEAW
jgi:PHD/YefM family antitoxin component YafN of YafNO toxin-antitoxin module